MSISFHLMAAIKYFLLVVSCEIGLFYLARSTPSVSDFVMPVTILVFLVFAWLLKLKIPALLLVVMIMLLYGGLSYYSDFPIYHVGYPASLEDFLSIILIKTTFYTFPLIAFIVVGKK